MKDRTANHVSPTTTPNLRRRIAALTIATVTLLATGCELWSADGSDYRATNGLCQSNKAGSCF